MGGYTEKNISQKNNKYFQYIPKWFFYMFGIYIFLSFFETYLTKFIGNSTKFYMFFLIVICIYLYRFSIKLNIYNILIMLWFVFKLISILWSNWSNQDISIHLLSQIGITIFVFIMTGAYYEEKFLSYILRINYWCSFIFGILSIIFQGSYISEVYAARKVLTLFGLQNDPNNCAAFLIIGISLAAYSLIYEHKRISLNIIVILVNIYATLLTSSRAGFVTLGVIILFLILMPDKNRKTQIFNVLLKLFIMAVVVGLALYLIIKFLPSASLERLLQFDEYQAGSGRSDRWGAAIQLFSQRPILGWGWGGYLTGYGAVHNTYLTSLCDIGILGTILLITPSVYAGYKAMKSKNVLVILILISGLLPAFFIDAINKRFFWNALLIAFMLVLYERNTGKEISIWNKGEEK